MEKRTIKKLRKICKAKKMKFIQMSKSKLTSKYKAVINGERILITPWNVLVMFRRDSGEIGFLNKRCCITLAEDAFDTSDMVQRIKLWLDNNIVRTTDNDDCAICLEPLSMGITCHTCAINMCYKCTAQLVSILTEKVWHTCITTDNRVIGFKCPACREFNEVSELTLNIIQKCVD